MSKWTRTRRDPGRSYSDDSNERTRRMLEKMREFLEEGVPEDEPEFIEAVKAAKPGISNRELADIVKQFRAVVAGRQWRDR